mmetsp:Transcript_23792/g.69689  ORF Transcript_23792/g.69689 Transcript_23792/m.69689 type:complete len:373 (+) Transcript_23792:2127-3245(+)
MELGVLSSNLFHNVRRNPCLVHGGGILWAFPPIHQHVGVRRRQMRLGGRGGGGLAGSGGRRRPRFLAVFWSCFLGLRGAEHAVQPLRRQLRDRRVVEVQPPVPFQVPNIGKVVASHGAPHMAENGEEFIFEGRRITALATVVLVRANKGPHVKEWRNGDAVVELDTLEGRVVKIEPLELQGQDVWEGDEGEALGVVVPAVARIAAHALQLFALGECSQGLLQCGHALHIQLQVPERLLPPSRVAAVQAPQVVHPAAFVAAGDVICKSLGLQVIEDDTHAFLHVLLDKGVRARPTKALGQSSSGHRSACTGLEPGKEPLELESEAPLWFSVETRVVSPVIHRSPELGHHEQCLEERVEVAGRSLVHQPREPCL